MDILKELEEKSNEITICYSVIRLQEQTISDLAEKIKHLEQLLLHPPTIIKKQEK